jgi:hypothetical protein
MCSIAAQTFSHGDKELNRNEVFVLHARCAISKAVQMIMICFYFMRGGISNRLAWLNGSGIKCFEKKVRFQMHKSASTLRRRRSADEKIVLEKFCGA